MSRTFRKIYKVPRAFLGPLKFDGGWSIQNILGQVQKIIDWLWVSYSNDLLLDLGMPSINDKFLMTLSCLIIDDSTNSRSRLVKWMKSNRKPRIRKTGNRWAWAWGRAHEFWIPASHLRLPSPLQCLHYFCLSNNKPYATRGSNAVIDVHDDT